MNDMNMTTPQMPPPPPQMPKPMAKMDNGMSSIVPIVIIVGILVLGGLYYLMTDMAPQQTLPTLDDTKKSSDGDVQGLLAQSNSDEVASIAADFNSTNLSSVDQASTDFSSSLASQ